MKCPKCGAGTVKSLTTDVFDLEVGIIVIRNIPCLKCAECDEVIYTGNVIRIVENIVAQVKNSLAEVTVIDFGKLAA